MTAPTTSPTSPTGDEDRRCRRGPDHCAYREPVRTDGGEVTGDYQAALLDDLGAVWCDGCRRHLGRALTELPDILASFTLARPTSFTVRYDTQRVTSGHLDHSSVPLELRLDAAQRYVTHETTVWADVVARTVGLTRAGEWTAHTCTLTEACTLLLYRVDQWLPLDARWYRARSITPDPRHDHPTHTLTWHDNDWWCHRNAAASAHTLVDVHHRLIKARAEYLADRDDTERTHHACPRCHTQDVWYRRAAAEYWCANCHSTHTEDTQLAALTALTAPVPVAA